MRVLFLAHRIPYPPDKGDKIRAYHEVRGLVSRGHEVHLLAFADDPDDLVHEAALQQLCRSATVVRLSPMRARCRAARCLLGTRPVSVGYFASGEMQRHVCAVLSRVRPDAVVVYSSTMAQFVPLEIASRTLVDLVDADSEKWRDYARSTGVPFSWLFRTESRRLRRYEHWIVGRFSRSLVSTDREAAVLLSGDPGDGRLEVLPNGVDLERFRPGAVAGSVHDAEGSAPLTRNQCIRRIVFTGAMDYRPNVDAAEFFAHDVLPIVRAHEPNVKFVIVGRNPTSAVRRLGASEGVHVTGTVTDVRPYLVSADAAVAPLRIARGVQNKILEAMAMGCAVVATPEASAGLSAQAGEHLLVASSPHEIAGAVVSLVRDGSLRLRLQTAARAFVERHHQWPSILGRFANVVEEVALHATPV